MKALDMILKEFEIILEPMRRNQRMQIGNHNINMLRDRKRSVHNVKDESDKGILGRRKPIH